MEKVYQEKRFIKRLLPLILAFVMLILGFLGGGLFSDLFRSEEARVHNWIYNTVSKNYLYYDTLTSEEKTLLLNSMDFYTYGGDRYSHYMSPSEVHTFFIEAMGEHYGIGVYLSTHDIFDTPENELDDALMIIQIINPAYIGLINKFDLVYGVEYTASSGELVQTMFFENEIHSPNDVMAEIDSIPNETDFTLYLNRLVSDDNGDFYLENNPNLVEVVVSKSSFDNPQYVTYFDENSPEFQNNIIDDKTAIIEFTSFSYPAAEQFEVAMNEFKRLSKNKLILDMRDNGGGELAILQEIASYLVKDSKNSSKVKLGYDINKNKKQNAFSTTSNKFDEYGIKELIILINGGSASATEALVNAIKDYSEDEKNTKYLEKFKLVGEQSFGKGIMQRVYLFDFMAYMSEEVYTHALYLTVSELYSPISKTSIHNIGFTPDSVVPPNLYASRMSDQQLQVAIDLINAQ